MVSSEFNETVMIETRGFIRILSARLGAFT
jgi:hypothetical protein